MSIFVEIGQNIIAIRQTKRMTQEALALNANMSVSYLCRIEHGTANPTLDALSRIADALDEPFNDVVEVKEYAEVG